MPNRVNAGVVDSYTNAYIYHLASLAYYTRIEGNVRVSVTGQKAETIIRVHAQSVVKLDRVES